MACSMRAALWTGWARILCKGRCCIVQGWESVDESALRSVMAVMREREAGINEGQTATPLQKYKGNSTTSYWSRGHIAHGWDRMFFDVVEGLFASTPFP